MPTTSEVRNHPLSVCLRLLAAFGDQGKIVWQLGELYAKRKKNPMSVKDRVLYLRKAIKHLRAKSLQQGMWRELPLDFRTFVESPVMLNKMNILWPKVMEEGENINSGRYVECVLTGAIGVAKSTLAIYTQAYQVYILSCMLNMHDVFDLDPSSEVLIVFQSVNKQVALDVDYRRLRDMISISPYFDRCFQFQKDRESDMRFPRNVIIKPVAGHDQAAIGQNVIGGILDEINFMAVVENSKQSTTGGTYDQATQNYDSIARRRESRFMKRGELPGMLCLVSSRKYPGQFTDKKEEEAKTNPRIYIYDKRIWDLRPENFSGEMFRLFVGDMTRKPRIIRETEEVAQKDVDLGLVINIPVEYRKQFESNILGALRDIAGVATQAMNPFMMNTEAINACFGKVFSIASREECDFVESRVALYPRRMVNTQQYRFAHLDMSITKDSCGVAVGHVPFFKKMVRGDVTELLPVVQFDMLLEVKPPRGGEIEYSQIRKLLYAIRGQGLPLRWVTCDTYQSTDMLQILAQNGFIVGRNSMDEDTTSYDILRQAIYDGRVLAPAHAKATIELVRLEFNSKDQKIDHPPHGSKDVGDAMAGVVSGLTMRRETWTNHGISMNNIPKSLTKAKSVASAPAARYPDRVLEEQGKARLADRIAEEKRDGKPSLIIPGGTDRFGRGSE